MIEFPSHWTNCQLGERIRFEYGKSPNEVRCSDGKYPVYGSSGKTALAINYTTESPAIIVGRKGTIDKPIFLQERCWAIDTTFFADKFPSDDPKYLFFLLDSINLRSLNESTGVPSLSRDALHSIPVSLPPLPEQKKIAEILSGIDEMINCKKRRIAKLSVFKSGLSIDLIYGKSVKKGVASGSISDIAEINPKTIVKLPSDSQISFIAMQDTSETGEVNRTQVRSLNEVIIGYTRFRNNDILVAKITPCFENGKGGFPENLLNGVGFGSTEFHVLRAIQNKAVSKFIHHITKSERFRKAGEASMTGSAGQKRIPADFIKHFSINIPSLSDQEEIACILTSIDMAIEKQAIEVNALANLKSSLAADLLSGRKRVSI